MCSVDPRNPKPWIVFIEMKKRLVIVISAFLLSLSFWAYFSIYLEKGLNSDELIFTIPYGEGSRIIGQRLENDQIIKDSFFFNLYLLLSGDRSSLQAGTYLIDPGMTIPEIVKKLSSGDVYQGRITIIEGWKAIDIANYLNDLDIVNKEHFLELVNSPYIFKEKYSFIGEEVTSLEGFLFPDTYLIPYESSEKEIIEIMLLNFDRKLNRELRSDIINQNKSIFEIITMASLIEKEVRTYEDKRKVSGLLWKRIEIGMPLQVDATIAYITGKNTTRISIQETRIDSLYNTYVYRGLPIAPISNPGINSIKAAIYPDPNEYLFYLSRPDGETVFSRNLEEHNIAKNKYLR